MLAASRSHEHSHGLVSEPALGNEADTHKNVPKMEEAINMAPSDYTAREGIESYY